MFKFFSLHDLLLIVAVALITRYMFAGVIRTVDNIGVAADAA